MNDAQSTIVGLKAQDCPGGGWNGMPPDIERATVADCLKHGVCGCIYGDAVQHISSLTAKLGEKDKEVEDAEDYMFRAMRLAKDAQARAEAAESKLAATGIGGERKNQSPREFAFTPEDEQPDEMSKLLSHPSEIPDGR